MMSIDVDGMPPDECLQLDAGGQQVACTQQPDGSWTIQSPTNPLAWSPFEMFGIAFVLILVLGVVGTWWRVRAARSMARSAGLDEGAAVRMALASEDGLNATYLASSLRGPVASQPVVRDTATRLRELDRLRGEGLVTDAEHAERRAAILAEI